MNTRIIRTTIAIVALAAMWFASMSAFDAQRAEAQCATLTVRNTTTCNLPLCFFNVVGSSCIIITPGIHVVNVPAGTTPGVTTICGNNYLMQALPSCHPGLLLLATCCVDVCFNPTACTVTFAPGTPPCHC